MRAFPLAAPKTLLRFAGKCLLAIGLLLPGTAGHVRADSLGDIRITPPPGWVSTPPYPTSLGQSPFPTLQYASANGRNASMILTLLPPDLLGYPVTDRPTLVKFGRTAAQPHFPASEPPPTLTEFTVGNGIGVCVTTQSSLPPGAAAPGNRRFTTIAVTLLESKHLVHCAISHEGDDTPEFAQAFQTLLLAQGTSPRMLASQVEGVRPSLSPKVTD